MGLIGRISSQRQQLIMDHARPHLDAGEEVLQWVRARPTDGRAEGFVYLTPKRCVIVWPGKKGQAKAILWDEMLAWGIDPNGRWGPTLGVEDEDGPCFAEIRASTGRMADDVAFFIRGFSDLAPQPERPLRGGGGLRSFSVSSPVPVRPKKRSLGGMTRGVLVTILGLSLAGTGIALSIFPGPWSIPLVLAGLAVLASEYDWAKDALEWSKDKYKKAREKIRSRRRSSA